MSNLIVYYSRKGQNYLNGSIKDLKKGNTEIAKGLSIHGAEAAQSERQVAEWAKRSV